jgi:tetraacyldisaccharide 4'-kinase
MEGDHIKIYDLLRPLSWLYGLGVGIRNTLFDFGLLKSESFDIPVISVGNITVGGTGKTPHTEYLIRLLKKNCQVAILSRGYKRKSSGFVLATTETEEKMIGDEPYQMKHKYPDIHMAVDKNRRRGIHKLCSPEIKPEVDVIILDDAYQHRYVLPGINILLMDYHRLICYDCLLPAGRLREPAYNKRRADIVIVTKCPDTITPMERRGIERSLDLYPWQQLYFTTFRYGMMYSLFDKSKPNIKLQELGGKKSNVLLLTGIGSPMQMEYDINKFTKFTPMHFSDHHDFTKKDQQRMMEQFNKLSGADKLVITTEKDSTRLLQCEYLDKEFKDSIYVLPVEVVFLNDSDEDFNNKIIGYVRKNSRNSTLLKRKNADKS